MEYSEEQKQELVECYKSLIKKREKYYDDNWQNTNEKIEYNKELAILFQNIHNYELLYELVINYPKYIKKQKKIHLFSL
ncbi:MAG: hypothetical protein PHY26_00475 [Bacilli bacterium]|jgi:hypothetical protein|nr:hypothetical protein [Bacilli bacterium]